MAQSLIIEQTDTNGKKVRKAVTDINPSATNAKVKTFGEMLTGLSTNSYNSSARVDKSELKPAELKQYTALRYNIGGNTVNNQSTAIGSDHVINVTLAQLSDYSNVFPNGITFALWDNDTGKTIPTEKIKVISTPPKATAIRGHNIDQPVYAKTLQFGIPANAPECLGEFKVHISENDGYAAFEFTVNVTAE